MSHNCARSKNGTISLLRVTFMTTLFAVISFADCADAQVPAMGEGYDIIVVAGQSNAAGYGLGPDGETDFSQDARIFQLRRSSDPQYNMDLVRSAKHLDHWLADRDRTAWAKRRSFDMAFARRYAKKYLRSNRRVLVVPSAYSGTSILLWNSDIEFQGDSTRLLNDMFRRIDVALNLPKWTTAGRGENRIVSFHWQQGERDIKAASNTNDSLYYRMKNAEVYKSHLFQLFSVVRNRYASSTRPFPILFGEPVRDWMVGSTVKASFIQAMRSLHNPTQKMFFITSENLNSNYQDKQHPTDTVHFSSLAQTRLGARRFNVYDYNFAR